MSKTSGNRVRHETWVRGRGTANPVTVSKVAVRNTLGQFHGATNFRGSESR